MLVTPPIEEYCLMLPEFVNLVGLRLVLTLPNGFRANCWKLPSTTTPQLHPSPTPTFIVEEPSRNKKTIQTNVNKAERK